VTKAQEVYERTEALVASGVRKAEAFRQLADELGQPFNSIRGAYYTHTRTLGGTPTQARSSRDPIESAVIVLEKALEGIDGEIEVAKNRATDAAAEYKHLRDSADERRLAIQAKIDALKA
jgi:hypothetical protein